MRDDSEKDTCSDCGTDNACYVRSHCMHKKVVRGISLFTDILCNTRTVWNRGNTSSTDDRVEFVARFEEAVDEFRDQNAAGSRNHE